MMFYLLSAIFLVGIATTNGFVDYRLARAGNGSKVCEKPSPSGYACKNCTLLVFCQNSSTGIVETSVGSCPNGKICIEGRCVTGTRCPVPLVKFVCSSAGIFPDPSTCTNYHICVSINDSFTHHEVLCEGNVVGQTPKYGFNPEKVACSDVIPANGVCQTNYVPVCKFIFDVGIIPRTSIYYECSYYVNDEGIINTDILYPYQKRCPNGKVYNIAVDDCR